MSRPSRPMRRRQVFATYKEGCASIYPPAKLRPKSTPFTHVRQPKIVKSAANLVFPNRTVGLDEKDGVLQDRISTLFTTTASRRTLAARAVSPSRRSASIHKRG